MNNGDWSRVRQHFWLCLFCLHCDFNSVIYYIQSTIFCQPGLLSTIPLFWLREPTDWFVSATRYSRTGQSRLRCQVLCGSALFFLLWPTWKWLLYPMRCQQEQHLCEDHWSRFWQWKLFAKGNFLVRRSLKRLTSSICSDSKIKVATFVALKTKDQCEDHWSRFRQWNQGKPYTLNLFNF